MKQSGSGIFMGNLGGKEFSGNEPRPEVTQAKSPLYLSRALKERNRFLAGE
jgi:hypothetical protein